MTKSKLERGRNPIYISDRSSWTSVLFICYLEILLALSLYLFCLLSKHDFELRARRGSLVSVCLWHMCKNWQGDASHGGTTITRSQRSAKPVSLCENRMVMASAQMRGAGRAIMFWVVVHLAVSFLWLSGKPWSKYFKSCIYFISLESEMNFTVSLKKVYFRSEHLNFSFIYSWSSRLVCSATVFIICNDYYLNQLP